MDDAASAELSGFRPCKRCTPNASTDLADMRQEQAVQEVQRSIAESILSATPVANLENLARQAGMSKCYLQKIFKKRVGMTPAKFSETTKGFLEMDVGDVERSIASADSTLP
jgi:AraC family transcriptional regulator of adaptative response/methylated-DNA-[protein]-cysteine methyltransferase